MERATYTVTAVLMDGGSVRMVAKEHGVEDVTPRIACRPAAKRSDSHEAIRFE